MSVVKSKMSDMFSFQPTTAHPAPNPHPQVRADEENVLTEALNRHAEEQAESYIKYTVAAAGMGVVEGEDDDGASGAPPSVAGSVAGSIGSRKRRGSGREGGERDGGRRADRPPLSPIRSRDVHQR